MAATLGDLRSLRPALDEYLDSFLECVKTTPSKRHFETYISGQIGSVERKTVEAMAIAAEVPVRTLQQFLGAYRWDDDAVAKSIRERVRDLHSGEEGIAIVDETGIPKMGNHTVGVQRQYCGRTGKVDNCMNTVGLGYVHRDFYCLLDTEIFLPEKSWGTQKTLRLEAGVPEDEVTYCENA